MPIEKELKYGNYEVFEAPGHGERAKLREWQPRIAQDVER